LNNYFVNCNKYFSNPVDQIIRIVFFFRFALDLNKHKMKLSGRIIVNKELENYSFYQVLPVDVLRSSYGFFPHFLFEVSEKDVDKKMAALAEYKTYIDRYYFDAQITRATMIRHGALAERSYAEGFDILRVVAQFGSTCEE